MRAPQPILTAHLFAPLNAELVALLTSLSADEWNAPTVAGAWTVKDVVAHLTDTVLRRLSLHRDGHFRPGPFDPNAANHEWIVAAQRLSPAVMIDLLDRYGTQQAAFFETLDPFAPAKWGVSWAGEEESENWFDVARELTERWHHQQQVRDATGRPPLYDTYLAPVIATFVRALPFTYRGVDATIVLRIDDQSWSLVEGSLFEGEAPEYATRVTMTGDRAWRMFTRQKIDAGAVIEGDAVLAAPLLSMTSVI
jgi:uncharacterized protein (TIGR03083 family)